MSKCLHPSGFFFRTHTYKSDGYPGKWYCKDGCGESYPYDPDDPKGIRYLARPNKPEKKITLAKGGKH